MLVIEDRVIVSKSILTVMKKGTVTELKSLNFDILEMYPKRCHFWGEGIFKNNFSTIILQSNIMTAVSTITIFFRELCSPYFIRFSFEKLQEPKSPTLQQGLCMYSE